MAWRVWCRLGPEEGAEEEGGREKDAQREAGVWSSLRRAARRPLNEPAATIPLHTLGWDNSLRTAGWGGLVSHRG